MGDLAVQIEAKSPIKLYQELLPFTIRDIPLLYRKYYPSVSIIAIQVLILSRNRLGYEESELYSLCLLFQ
jgi:hypothetical protein